MRRTDREVTDPARIREILDRARVIRLGLNGGPYPYVVPMNYGYTLKDALVFYTHCAPEGEKLDRIRADSRVGFELDCDTALVGIGDKACVYGYAYASVFGHGTAEIVSDPAEKAEALKILMKTQTGRDFVLTEQMAEAVCVLKITAEEYTAKCRPLPQNTQSED